MVEWIPKSQNKNDAWFSGIFFSKMARKSSIFHIRHDRKYALSKTADTRFTKKKCQGTKSVKISYPQMRNFKKS